MKKCKCGKGYNREFIVRDFCVQNFPFIADDFDALTTYELLQKVICFLREMGVQVKDLTDAFNNLSDDFDTLYDFVIEYFDNLDVQQEINNKLDEMSQDGTLQEVFARFKNFEGQKLSYVRFFTRFLSGENADYWQVQGTVMSDRETLIYGLAPRAIQGETKGKLVRQSISTQQILAEVVSDKIGHANDLTLFKDELYVTPSPLTDANGTLYHTFQISVFDPITLNFKRSIDLFRKVDGCPLDDPECPLGESTLQVKCNGICNDGDKIYIFSVPDNMIYILNEETGECTEYLQPEKAIIEDEYAGVYLAQGIEYYNGCFLFPYGRPAYIKVTSAITGKIVHHYQLPFMNNGVYTGELEAICTVPNSTDIILSAHTKSNNLDNSANVNFYRCNFQQGYFNDLVYRTFGITQGRVVNLFVDCNGDGILPNGSLDHPFLNLQDAIDAVRQNEYKSATIKIMSSGTYTMQVGVLSTPIIVEPRTDDLEVILLDCDFYYTDRLVFRNVTFKNELRDSAVHITYTNFVEMENVNVIQTNTDNPAIELYYVNKFYPINVSTTGGKYGIYAKRTHVHGRITGSGYTDKLYMLGAYTYLDINPEYVMLPTNPANNLYFNTETSKTNGLTVFYNADSPPTTGTITPEFFNTRPTHIIIQFIFENYIFERILATPTLTGLTNRVFSQKILKNTGDSIDLAIGVTVSDRTIVINYNRKQVNSGSVENATIESTKDDFIGIRRIYALFN